MQLNRQAAGIGHLWKRIVVLSLCVCLLTAGSAQGAKNQLLSVSALETKQLRKLLKSKRISAILADGTNLLGRVKKVQDGLVVVDIQESPGSSPVESGLQEIPADRISTVYFTRYQGKWKAGLGTLFSVGGLFLASGVVGDCEGCERGETRNICWDLECNDSTRLPVGNKERQEERHLGDQTTRSIWRCPELRNTALGKCCC